MRFVVVLMHYFFRIRWKLRPLVCFRPTALNCMLLTFSRTSTCIAGVNSFNIEIHSATYNNFFWHSHYLVLNCIDSQVIWREWKWEVGSIVYEFRELEWKWPRRDWEDWVYLKKFQHTSIARPRKHSTEHGRYTDCFFTRTIRVVTEKYITALSDCLAIL